MEFYPAIKIIILTNLEQIALEFTSQEIAEKLFLSYRTVENHRVNLMIKMDVKNMAGLVRKQW